MSANGYTDRALSKFPGLLVEMVRGHASTHGLRAEGFKGDEIAAVRALVALSDREEIDAGKQPGRDGLEDTGSAQTGEAVTVPTG